MTTLNNALSQLPAGGRLLGPLGFWHAAALEQLPTAKMLDVPDATARALNSSAKLYGLDLVAAVPVQLVAWAARAAVMPGAPLSAIAASHDSNATMGTPPDPEHLGDSVATEFATGVLARLKTLLPKDSHVAAVLPTPPELMSSLGGSVPSDWAAEAIGSVLRALGPSEPDAVIVIGEGEGADNLSGLCDYFDITLVEATSEESDEISALTGQEFLEGGPARGRLVVTRTELPAATDPRVVTTAVQSLRGKAGN